MKKLKQKEAITLIALIITIIVLLILAGITINMLTGDNGILKTSQTASIETRAASVEEARDIWFTEVKTAKIAGGTSKDLDTILADLKKQNLLTDKEITTIKNHENKEITIGSKTISFDINVPTSPKHSHVASCYSTECQGTFAKTGTTTETWKTCTHTHTGDSTNGGGCYGASSSVECGGAIVVSGTSKTYSITCPECEKVTSNVYWRKI